MTTTSAQRRTLNAASGGTLLVLVTFATPLTTLSSTARTLHAAPGGQTWMLSGISLGLACALLLAGALADGYGRRRVFTAGSGGAGRWKPGLRRRPQHRGVRARLDRQGVGGAAIIACSLGLIGHAFPPGGPRAHATGVWGASVGAGLALGPLLAAGLEHAGSWRSAYWLVVAGAAALAGTSRALAESRGHDQRSLDLPGAVTFVAALACLLAGFVQGRSGWARPATLSLLAAAAAMSTLFLLIEKRISSPMLDLDLFRRPDLVAATVAARVTGAGVIALMSYLPTLLQRGLQRSAVTSAVVLLAWSVTSVFTALGARRLPGRFSSRPQLITGLAVGGAGQAALTALGATSSPARLLPGLLVAGAGSGLLNAALGRAAVTSVPEGRAGLGSGANNTACYLGSAVGVAVVVLVVAAHSAPTSSAALLSGWNAAAGVTAATSFAGAVTVHFCRPRTGR